jgi:hypothetical protein
VEIHTAATQADWIAEAERRRDRGIDRALTHAELVRLGWNLSADKLLDQFLLDRTPGCQFLAEELVAYALDSDLDEPPDPRAWGGVIRRAAKLGKIVRVGYARAASSNMSPKCLWQGRAR